MIHMAVLRVVIKTSVEHRMIENQETSENFAQSLDPLVLTFRVNASAGPEILFLFILLFLKVSIDHPANFANASATKLTGFCIFWIQCCKYQNVVLRAIFPPIK